MTRGVRQLVVLGAGLDRRAAGLWSTTPATQEWKRTRLRDACFTVRRDSKRGEKRGLPFLTTCLRQALIERLPLEINSREWHVIRYLSRPAFDATI